VALGNGQERTVELKSAYREGVLYPIVPGGKATLKQHLDTFAGARRAVRRSEGAPRRAHDLRGLRRQGLRVLCFGAAVIKRRTVLGAAGASLLAAPALGQAYPNKPLKMVVPYPPGGGTDGLGRITSEFLSQKLGQPIVVQNIGGASPAPWVRIRCAAPIPTATRCCSMRCAPRPRSVARASSSPTDTTSTPTWRSLFRLRRPPSSPYPRVA